MLTPSHTESLRSLCNELCAIIKGTASYLHRLPAEEAIIIGTASHFYGLPAEEGLTGRLSSLQIYSCKS